MRLWLTGRTRAQGAQGKARQWARGAGVGVLDLGSRTDGAAAPSARAPGVLEVSLQGGHPRTGPVGDGPQALRSAAAAPRARRDAGLRG